MVRSYSYHSSHIGGKACGATRRAAAVAGVPTSNRRLAPSRTWWGTCPVWAAQPLPLGEAVAIPQPGTGSVTAAIALATRSGSSQATHVIRGSLRNQLSWRPTPRKSVTRRLVFLIENMKKNPELWQTWNEAMLQLYTQDQINSFLSGPAPVPSPVSLPTETPGPRRTATPIPPDKQ